MGYRFSKQFNESHAFREQPAAHVADWDRLHGGIVSDMSGAEREGIRRCASCGELLDKWGEPLTGLKLKRRRYDLSATYDGVTIASERFKDFCKLNHLTGLRFVPLPNDSEFYAVYPTEMVNFDFDRAGTRFIKPCPVCGRHESVVGATPYLKEGSVIPDAGFVRTDLEFGSNDEKHPLLLCGDRAGMLLKAAKLKGVHLEPLPHA